MARATRRSDSSVYQLQKRVPQYILDNAQGRPIVIRLPARGADPEAMVSSTITPKMKFSLRTRDPAVAKARIGVVTDHLESVFAAIRQGPAPLTQKQIVALSGEVYKLYVERFEDNPGTPDAWTAWKAFNRAVIEGRVATAPAIKPGEGESEDPRAVFGDELTSGINALPKGEAVALEARFGRLTDWVLTLHGLEVDRATRAKLLYAVAQASQDVGWALKRKAHGDFSPDPKASRFPSFEKDSGLTLTALFEKWMGETKPAASTVTTWRSALKSLQDSLGHEHVRRITDTDVVAWKDDMVAQGRKAKGINNGPLAAVNALFNYAVRNKLIGKNPAAGVRVVAKSRAGESMIGYSDAEVARLLGLARKETNAGRRWLPWLAALSGARIGELAQLSGSRIIKEDGVPCMRLAPAEDGGSLKNEGSERTVPLHSALIAEGFLDFVATKGEKPLFYRQSSGNSTKRHAAKGISNHLGTWIREQGFTDPRKAPNHALRHWFKSACVKAGVSDSTADRIQGHAGQGEASRYRHFELETLAKAVNSIEVPRLSGGGEQASGVSAQFHQPARQIVDRSS